MSDEKTTTGHDLARDALHRELSDLPSALRRRMLRGVDAILDRLDEHDRAECCAQDSDMDVLFTAFELVQRRGVPLGRGDVGLRKAHRVARADERRRVMLAIATGILARGGYELPGTFEAEVLRRTERLSALLDAHARGEEEEP